MNPIEKLLLVMMKQRLLGLFALEESLAKQPQAILALADAPERRWPDLQKFTSGEQIPSQLKTQMAIRKPMFKTGDQIKESISSLALNPQNGRATIEQDELEALTMLARGQGAGLIGYTKLPYELIFKDRAVMFDAAIVLGTQLDQQAVADAPSQDTYVDSINSYDVLGSAANLLAKQLRDLGFAAHVSHPLGGLVLYPPLAAKAGLGKLGRHGLLITPQYGPRQRLAAVFTNISNLPFVDVGYQINDSCENCGRCQKACPAQAFFDEPIWHSTGRRTSVDEAKCSVQFAKSFSCSVCLRVCATVNPGGAER